MLNILYNMNILIFMQCRKQDFFFNITLWSVQQGRLALVKYCVVEIAIYYRVSRVSCLSSNKSVDRMDLLIQTLRT